MTPEGKIKAKVKKVLQEYDCWNYWPVPSGYGRRTVDTLCLRKGVFFVIETKAPGKKPTNNQYEELHQIALRGGRYFIIDSDEGVRNLRTWLEGLNDTR